MADIENLEFQEITQLPTTEIKEGFNAIGHNSDGETKTYPLDKLATKDEVAKKQIKLIPGENVTITPTIAGDIISSTGGGSGVIVDISSADDAKVVSMWQRYGVSTGYGTFALGGYQNVLMSRNNKSVTLSGFITIDCTNVKAGGAIELELGTQEKLPKCLGTDLLPYSGIADAETSVLASTDYIRAHDEGYTSPVISLGLLTKAVGSGFTRVKFTISYLTDEQFEGEGGGGGGSIDITHENLKLLVADSALKVGESYRITDFQTIYKQPETNILKYGAVEPLIVKAQSTNTLELLVKSALRPNDIIYYDINKRNSWSDPNANKGDIFRRIDPNGNDLPYDFKSIMFRRWKIDASKYDTHVSTKTYNRGDEVKYVNGSVMHILQAIKDVPIGESYNSSAYWLRKLINIEKNYYAVASDMLFDVTSEDANQLSAYVDAVSFKDLYTFDNGSGVDTSDTANVINNKITKTTTGLPNVVFVNRALNNNIQYTDGEVNKSGFTIIGEFNSNEIIFDISSIIHNYFNNNKGCKVKKSIIGGSSQNINVMIDRSLVGDFFISNVGVSELQEIFGSTIGSGFKRNSLVFSINSSVISSEFEANAVQSNISFCKFNEPINSCLLNGIFSYLIVNQAYSNSILPADSNFRDNVISWLDIQGYDDSTVNAELAAVNQKLSALKGAYIYRGKIDRSTTEIQNNLTLLTVRLIEILSRPPELGDVLTDKNKCEWYFNDTSEWDEQGISNVDLVGFLGETASTAYRGDRGKTAFDHVSNSNVHVSTGDKNNWNNKADQTALSAETTARINADIANLTLANEYTDSKTSLLRNIQLFLKAGNIMDLPRPTGAGTSLNLGALSTTETLKYFAIYTTTEDLIISANNSYLISLIFGSIENNRNYIFRYRYFVTRPDTSVVEIFNVIRPSFTITTGTYSEQFNVLNNQITDITIPTGSVLRFEIYCSLTSSTDTSLTLLVNDVNNPARLSRNENTANVGATEVITNARGVRESQEVFNASHTHKKLENKYDLNTRPTTANIPSSADRAGSLEVFKATSLMTEGKPAADSHILHLNWDSLGTNGAYDAQIAVPILGSAPMQFRKYNAATGIWGTWINIIDENNLYTKGTFTPSIEGGTTVGVANYATRIGNYSVIGNQCFIEGTLQGTFTQKPTGQAIIKNLPFVNNGDGLSLPIIAYGLKQESFINLGSNDSTLKFYYCPYSLASASAFPVNFGAELNDNAFNIRFKLFYTIK